MSSNVLVTGAAGFIGQNLVKQLIARGDRVRCLVRPTSNIAPLKQLDCELVHADVVNDPSKVSAAVRGCDTVFHLAASTAAVDSRELVDTNPAGTEVVLNACAQPPRAPKLILVSSIAAVGKNLCSKPHRENAARKPISDYGRSKAACETLAHDYASRIPISIVRPPIVLGPGDRQGFELFNIIDRLGWHFVPTFSTYQFSVIHVDDLVTALIKVASQGTRLDSNRDTDSGIYFAAAEETPTYSELGRMIGRALGRKRTRVLRIAKPVLWIAAMINQTKGRLSSTPQFLNPDKYREATTGSWTCSSEKIRTEIGFVPACSLKQRLEQTAQWYRRVGWLKEKRRGESADTSRQISKA